MLSMLSMLPVAGAVLVDGQSPAREARASPELGPAALVEDGPALRAVEDAPPSQVSVTERAPDLGMTPDREVRGDDDDPVDGRSLAAEMKAPAELGPAAFVDDDAADATADARAGLEVDVAASAAALGHTRVSEAL
jgi:hypothetical protein